MLIGLFEALRAERVPVALREWLDLLAALDCWVAVDELPNADRLLADLAEAGLLEVRR